MTELGYAERYTVICEEKAPILKMAMTPDQSSIWVATSESTINNWVSKILHILISLRRKTQTTQREIYLFNVLVYKPKGLARIGDRRLLRFCQ